jgi:hypothetical protein
VRDPLHDRQATPVLGTVGGRELDQLRHVVADLDPDQVPAGLDRQGDRAVGVHHGVGDQLADHEGEVVDQAGVGRVLEGFGGEAPGQAGCGQLSGELDGGAHP